MPGKIVVTGALGFIGSHLVDRLLAEKYDVVAYDDSSSGTKSNVGKHLSNTHFELTVGDVRDRNKLTSAVAGANTVVHLAAIVSVTKSFREPLLVNDVNVNGTLAVLNACREGNVKRVVYASSAAVYGGSAPPLREDFVPRPLSPYGASKASAEAYCQSFGKTYGLNVTILRLMNVYGTRMAVKPDAGVFVKFAQAILEKRPLVLFGDGSQTRDFTHVKDVVEAILLSLKYHQEAAEIFNIGTGEATKLIDLAVLFQEVAGVEAAIEHRNPREGDIRHSFADIGKASLELGYEPTVSLRDGLREFWAWFRSRQESPNGS
jgi:UDP-glucose 4-epimerase